VPDKMASTGNKFAGMDYRKLNKQQLEARREMIFSSLCWTCERAMWDCLCEWPLERWEGMRTEPAEEELELVRQCPGYWPEGRGDNARAFKN